MDKIDETENLQHPSLIFSLYTRSLKQEHDGSAQIVRQRGIRYDLVT